MDVEEENKYRKLAKEMIDTAFALDKIGYKARTLGIDYKAKEYFEAAISLRNSANLLEYALS